MLNLTEIYHSGYILKFKEDKFMRKKGLITLLTLCVTACMLSGCTAKESKSSDTKKNT